MFWRLLVFLVCYAIGIHSFKLPAKDDDRGFLEEFSSYMNENIDKSIDPCRDFHRFACGNFQNNKHLGDAERTTSVYKQLQNSTTKYIQKVILESNEEVLKIPKIYLQNCLAYSNEQKLIDIDKILELCEKYVPDWRSLTFDGIEELLHVSHFHHEHKANILLSGAKSLRSKPDPNGFKSLQKAFGESIYFNYSEEDFDDVQEFIEAYKTLLENSQETLEKQSLKSFIDDYSSNKINWTEFFNTTSYGILKNSTEIFTAIEDFDPLIRFLRLSNPKVIFNYIKWTKVLQDYGYLKRNVSNRNTWARFCIEDTMSTFKVAISSVVLKKLVSPERRSDILEIAGSISDQLYNRIDNIDWLDESTKAFLKTNLNTLDIFAGYTDDSIDVNISQKYYEDLGVSEGDDYLEMNIKYIDFIKRKKFSTIGHSIEVAKQITRLLPNAYAVKKINNIFILATYMQVPMYHKAMPLSLKYSGIGADIGHEITHSFDGKNFVFDYNYKDKSDEISDFSKFRFNERKACFESQYDKFSMDDFVNNGLQTLNENMADNGGIRISYDAYVDSVGNETLDSYEDQKLLSNLDTHYTNKQIFFLHAAQMRCNSFTPAQVKEYYKSDVHSYDKFRVNGMLSNMEEFSEAFECPLGSNMNPFKKCYLW